MFQDHPTKPAPMLNLLAQTAGKDLKGVGEMFLEGWPVEGGSRGRYMRLVVIDAART